MTIDLAKIFPAAGRQDRFAAGKRNTAEQKKISNSDSEHRARAELREKSRAPHGPIKQNEKADANQKYSSEEHEYNDRRKVRHELGHFSSPDFFFSCCA
jgi:hypothetical protein